MCRTCSIKPVRIHMDWFLGFVAGGVVGGADSQHGPAAVAAAMQKIY